MYVNAGMYEEFNAYRNKYKNEKIKEYKEKKYFFDLSNFLNPRTTFQSHGTGI